MKAIGFTESQIRKQNYMPDTQEIEMRHIIYSKTQIQINAKKEVDLSRIASYEINYLNEHRALLKQKPLMKVTYVQPSNKKDQLE